jgi:predicted metal-dependent hydrolase
MMEFHYTITRRPRRKTVAIIVHPDKSVEILAPAFLKENEIHAIAERKKQWIATRLKEWDTCDIQTAHHLYDEGEQFLFRGEYFPLAVINGRDDVRIAADTLLAAVPLVLTKKERRSYIRARLQRFFFSQAGEILKAKTFELSLLCGCMPSFVAVKEYKSRWGCCFGDGRIYYNWRIIMAPDDIIDYLVVHELCHLMEANHSRRYWGLVEKHVPDWREKRDWLRRNGHKLVL